MSSLPSTTPPGAGSPETPSRATLGLTGLTVNAMALIAPGAFLWLTLEEQCTYGQPLAGQAMWFGILAALLLCFATAISYAELSKLYPGAGSSYFFVEQAFLSKTHAYKFARLAKFITGWASHLYYWVYPGCMVGVTAILVGYLANQLMPNTFSANLSSPPLMFGFCIVFAFGVAYIAYRGVNGTTGVNMAINIIQISALLVFTVIAIGYRTSHPDGSVGFHLSNGNVIDYQVDQTNVLDDKGKPVQDTWADKSPTKTDEKGNPVFKTQDRQITQDDLNNKAIPLPASLGVGDPYPVLEKDAAGKLVLKDGHAVAVSFKLSYAQSDAVTGKKGDAKNPETFNFHPSAASVIAPHKFNYVIIQACVAILILVGFESVTSMGEEARNAKRDIPRAVLLSLAIQGMFCYLIEYFAANYMLNSGYTMSNAAASGAPLGDLMQLAGAWLFGSVRAGWWFMFIQAITVFLALIGTTLSCLNTGARVTYAMGRDNEVSSHFGVLHGRNLTPHRAIWTLAAISVVIGIITCVCYLGGSTPSPLEDNFKGTFWYSFGVFSPATIAAWPNTLLIVTLVSNFGTFLLYMLTCYTAVVAFKEHHTFNGFKHFVVPIFGLLANLGCMLFYIIGPLSVPGMSAKEPFIALGVVAVFGIWGAIYFVMGSKKKGKTVFLEAKPVST